MNSWRPLAGGWDGGTRLPCTHITLRAQWREAPGTPGGPWGSFRSPQQNEENVVSLLFNTCEIWAFKHILNNVTRICLNMFPANFQIIFCKSPRGPLTSLLKDITWRTMTTKCRFIIWCFWGSNQWCWIRLPDAFKGGSDWRPEHNISGYKGPVSAHWVSWGGRWNPSLTPADSLITLQ